MRWRDQPGSLAESCHYALMPPGKLFRPTLLLESALAVGSTLESVLPAAVGAECGHVASLVHDDIIDGDDMRRGRPSVHHQFGLDVAIVAGDALIFDLFASLAECRRTGVPADRVVAALEAVARAGLDLCRGQLLEADICRERRIDVQSYLSMISLKTAALFQGACESGAILGGGSETQVAALGRFGQSLGLVFQIHDDLLPYVSDTVAMGKPQTSDVRNGRITLPVILGYQAAGEADASRLDECLSGQGDTVASFSELRDLLGRKGAIDAAMRLAAEHAGRAGRALAELPPTPSRARLEDLIGRAAARSR